jgi:hypothetical protein
MDYFGLAGVIIAVAGLLITYFGFVLKVSERMTKVETKVDLFWKVIETNVGSLLKSPTHVEKDMLLDKLSHRELNIKEAETLRSILTDEMQLKGRSDAIIAYSLIIGRLEQILYELRSKKK